MGGRGEGTSILILTCRGILYISREGERGGTILLIFPPAFFSHKEFTSSREGQGDSIFPFPFSPSSISIHPVLEGERKSMHMLTFYVLKVYIDWGGKDNASVPTYLPTKVNFLRGGKRLSTANSPLHQGVALCHWCSLSTIMMWQAIVPWPCVIFSSKKHTFKIWWFATS